MIIQLDSIKKINQSKERIIFFHLNFRFCFCKLNFKINLKFFEYK